jgi:hypothetical protein
MTFRDDWDTNRSVRQALQESVRENAKELELYFDSLLTEFRRYESLVGHYREVLKDNLR